MDENENKNGIYGNDRRSIKPQHIYQIFDWFKSIVFKYGVSGSKLNKDGSSPRANLQVNQKNKETGKEQYSAEILQTNIENREKALEIEKQLVTEFFEKNNKKPDGNIRPEPDKETQNNSNQES